MKNVLTIAFLAVALVCGSVHAQDGTGTGSGNKKSCGSCDKASSVASDGETCTGGSCTKSSSALASADGSACKECPVSLAMAKLPKMSYRVGTEDTCCSKSATKLAEEKKVEMKYVVGEKVFEDKTLAYTSLVESTEAMVKEFVTLSKDETTGVNTIAGESCKCSVKAGKKAELVSAAIKDIKMSYVVGEETCNCPMKAGKLAKAANTEMKYMVGEEACNCPLKARLNLAHAQYKAAVKATLVKTEKPAATAEKTEAKDS